MEVKEGRRKVNQAYLMDMVCHPVKAMPGQVNPPRIFSRDWMEVEEKSETIWTYLDCQEKLRYL